MSFILPVSQPNNRYELKGLSGSVMIRHFTVNSQLKELILKNLACTLYEKIRQANNSK